MKRLYIYINIYITLGNPNVMWERNWVTPFLPVKVTLNSVLSTPLTESSTHWFGLQFKKNNWSSMSDSENIVFWWAALLQQFCKVQSWITLCVWGGFRRPAFSLFTLHAALAAQCFTALVTDHLLRLSYRLAFPCLHPGSLLSGRSKGWITPAAWDSCCYVPFPFCIENVHSQWNAGKKMLQEVSK